MSTIIDTSSAAINWNAIAKCTAPRACKASRVINVMNMDNGKQLMFSLPLLLTWGAQEKEDPTTKVKKGDWAMALQFPNAEYKNEETDMALANMKGLEQWAKQQCINNGLDWFGHEVSKELMGVLSWPMLKYPKVSKGSPVFDYTKQPTLGVNIPQRLANKESLAKQWTSEIYDEEGQPLFLPKSAAVGETPLPHLQKFAYVAALVKVAGIWLAGGKMSITFDLVQGVVKSPQQDIITPGVCQLAIKPADKAKLKAQPDISSSSADTMTIEDDSADMDDDLYAAVAAVALPPPAPVASTAPPAPAPVSVAPSISVAPSEPVMAEAEVTTKKVVKAKPKPK